MMRRAMIVSCFLSMPALANSSAYDLIYDPADGAIWFDTNGGRIIHYVIDGGPYLHENHINPLTKPAPTSITYSYASQLAGENLAAQFISDPVTIGQVLPAGLTEQAFYDRFNHARFVRTLGDGGAFEMFYDWPATRQPAFDNGPSTGTTKLSIAAQGLFDASGQPLTSSVKTIAVIDVDGDGIDGFDFDNWAGDSFLPDPDDVLVTGVNKGVWNEYTGDGDHYEDRAPDGVKFSVIDSSREAPYEVEVVNFTDNDDTRVGTGDQVYLFYFPDLPLDAESPGEFQPFGVFEAGSMSEPGELTYLLTINADTIYLANNETDAGIVASFATVPEPGSLLALALPCLLIARRRRA